MFHERLHYGIFAYCPEYYPMSRSLFQPFVPGVVTQ